MIKKMSFVVAVVGISILVGLLLIDSREADNIEKLVVGSKVSVSGVVNAERQVGDRLSIINLEDVEFDVICDCSESYLDKEIVVEGVVEEFNGEKQVRVLKLVEKK